MPLYVTVEHRTLREAIERAEADACSCVVAVHVETAEQVRRWHFWERIDAQRQADQFIERCRDVRTLERMLR